MKINTPKELTLGIELEAMADMAIQEPLDKAIEYVTEILKTYASWGHYSVTLKLDDIEKACGAEGFVLVHLENWLIDQGIQIVQVKDKGNELSLAWGVAKWPEGFSSAIIEGVRG